MTHPMVPLPFTLEFPHLGDKVRLTQQGSSLLMDNKVIMDTFVHDPSNLMAALTEALSRHLRQHNSANNYDKIVLLFRNWTQVSIFIKWIKLAEYQVKIKGVVEINSNSFLFTESIPEPCALCHCSSNPLQLLSNQILGLGNS